MIPRKYVYISLLKECKSGSPCLFLRDPWRHGQSTDLTLALLTTLQGQTPPNALMNLVI